KFCSAAATILLAAAAPSAFMRIIFAAAASCTWPIRAATKADSRPNSSIRCSSPARALRELVERGLHGLRLDALACHARRHRAEPGRQVDVGVEETGIRRRMGGFKIAAHRLLARAPGLRALPRRCQPCPMELLDRNACHGAS